MAELREDVRGHVVGKLIGGPGSGTEVIVEHGQREYLHAIRYSPGQVAVYRQASVEDGSPLFEFAFLGRALPPEAAVC